MRKLGRAPFCLPSNISLVVLRVAAERKAHNESHPRTGVSEEDMFATFGILVSVALLGAVSVAWTGSSPSKRKSAPPFQVGVVSIWLPSSFFPTKKVQICHRTQATQALLKNHGNTDKHNNFRETGKDKGPITAAAEQIQKKYRYDFKTSDEVSPEAAFTPPQWVQVSPESWPHLPDGQSQRPMFPTACPKVSLETGPHMPHGQSRFISS